MAFEKIRNKSSTTVQQYKIYKISTYIIWADQG